MEHRWSFRSKDSEHSESMIMFSNTNKNDSSIDDCQIAIMIIFDFTRQLRGWWDNYLAKEQRNFILTSHKVDKNGVKVLDENDEPIKQMVHTLIFSISQHFIGDPSHYSDKSLELLSNM